MSIVFVLLGGWGIVISLYLLAGSAASYRQNSELARWAKVSENLIVSIQHLSFERGRSAVVLRGPDPISNANRVFIADRRRHADEALEKSLAVLSGIPEARYDVISERLRAFRALRPDVDRNVEIPLPLRDADLSGRWFDASTRLIESLKYAVDILIGNYIPGDARRLASLASGSLELRISAGTEATFVAQAASSGRKPSAEVMGKIHRLRGIEDRLWHEIILDTGYLKKSRLMEKVREVRDIHMAGLRAFQDRALADDLRTARMAAERAKNPPAEEPHHGRGVDWTQVITDVIIHSMDKG